MIFQTTQNFIDKLHISFIDKSIGNFSKEERNEQWQKDCIFFRDYKEKYFSNLQSIFKKFVERINIFLNSKKQTHINVVLNTIEMMYVSEYILALSESDYVNIFEIEGINEIGMCRYDSKFINQLIDLNVNDVIRDIINELEFAWQSNNKNFKCKQLENEIDLVDVAVIGKKILLITLDININNDIIPFYLNFPTEISKMLK